MAGYEYRGTEARQRRAEEFSRRRAAAEASRKLKAEAEKKRPARPKPTEPKPTPDEPKEQIMKPASPTAAKPTKIVDEFAVIEEEPPPLQGASGGVVKNAALEALQILRGNPLKWFRVATRDSKTKASSYAATLHKHSETLETRTAVDDDGRGILYARINPDRPPKSKAPKP